MTELHIEAAAPSLMSTFAHALLFNFDASAMKSVVSLHAHIIYYYRYYCYRMLRPQASPPSASYIPPSCINFDLNVGQQHPS